MVYSDDINSRLGKMSCKDSSKPPGDLNHNPTCIVQGIHDHMHDSQICELSLDPKHSYRLESVDHLVFEFKSLEKLFDNLFHAGKGRQVGRRE